MKLIIEKLFVGFVVISLAILVFILFSCVPTPQAPVPTMPEMTTEQAKACAHACQSIYVLCNSACGQMRGGVTTARQRRQCLDNCNQILKDCYSTCVNE